MFIKRLDSTLKTSAGISNDGVLGVSKFDTFMTGKVAKVYYNDGTTEEAHQDKVTRDIKDGKDYWGYQHVNQIEEFYKAALGLTTFSVTGKEALKTHKLI